MHVVYLKKGYFIRHLFRPKTRSVYFAKKYTIEYAHTFYASFVGRLMHGKVNAHSNISAIELQEYTSSPKSHSNPKSHWFMLHVTIRLRREVKEVP